jgi:CRISPR-associated exonuclease Cas4
MAFIKASEISDFLYCERLWWLKKRNYFGQLQPRDAALAVERLNAGTEYHQAYSTNVRYASAGRSASRKFVLLSLLLILLLILFLLFFFGQAHGAEHKPRAGAERHGTKGQTATVQTKHPQDQAVNIVFFLEIAAVAVMAIAFMLRRLGRRRERRWQMPPGNLISLDDGNAETLVCDVLGLVGKPDVVRREGDFFVPEERKSRVLAPGRDPFRDHILQLAAYCYLVTKNLGPVQKGILTYGNGQQREVLFTNELMDELRQVINRIRSMQSAEVVHRNHRTASRCSRCVARNMCFEALS